ncbi:hypothetical protein N7540_003029 [Penicillium herquei]|nr:hypothetical protein N7540_003029 [Penicillium herquei]
MTIQFVVPNLEKSYPRRRDRLHEEPSAKNAQGLFPPDACIFVGNLSTKVCTDDLAEDLKKVFTEFGPCHVKIKQDKKKGLPGAFVQFEKVEDASAALVNTDRVMLHDRWLRIERAKGRILVFAQVPPLRLMIYLLHWKDEVLWRLTVSNSTQLVPRYGH